jgi:hypothetical protein
MSNLAAAWTNIALERDDDRFVGSGNMLVTKLQQKDIRRCFRTGAVTTVNIDLTYSRRNRPIRSICCSPT